MRLRTARGIGVEVAEDALEAHVAQFVAGEIRKSTHLEHMLTCIPTTQRIPTWMSLNLATLCACIILDQILIASKIGKTRRISNRTTTTHSTVAACHAH